MQTTLRKLVKKTVDKKVGDMTVGELKELIKDVVQEVIDPDYGLELRPEVEAELRESLKRKEKGIPLERGTFGTFQTQSR